jgi:hypothetical protein
LYSKKPLEISLGIYKDGCIAILLHKLTHEVEPMMVVYSCIGKIHLVTNTSFNVVFLWEQADHKLTPQNNEYRLFEWSGGKTDHLPAREIFLEEAHAFSCRPIFSTPCHAATPASICICYTERKKTKREIKKVVLMDAGLGREGLKANKTRANKRWPLSLSIFPNSE